MTSLQKKILSALLTVGFIVSLLFLLVQNKYTEVATVLDSQSTDVKLAPRGNTTDMTTAQKNSLSTNTIIEPTATSHLAAGCQLSATIQHTISNTSVQYSITLTNTGQYSCENVTYSVYYPQNEIFDSAFPTPSASDYYWAVGTLAANGGSIENHITTTMTDEFGGIELCATASNFVGDVCATAVTPSKQITSVQTSNTNEGIPSDLIAKVPLATTVPLVVPEGKEYGIWVWNSPATMSATKMDKTINKIKTSGFNVAYVSVDDVFTYDKNIYTKALALFVTKANAKGIAVDVVAGGSDWAKISNRSKGYDIIDFIIAYNATNPKVRSFQYDVEPYLLPEYEGNKEPVLTDFVSFIDESEKKLHDTGITFSVVLPHFYDSTQAWTPKIMFNGNANFTFNHIQTILDRSTDNHIIIMAYRNYFGGAGGTQELVTPEIVQSSKTKVIVAQETSNVQPNYVTFFGKSKVSLYTSLASIFSTFSTQPGFGGVAVHYLETFVSLQN